MKNRILVFLAMLALSLIAFEVKFRVIESAFAQVRLDPPQELIVRSPNNVIWKITVDNSGVLGTDSIGVWQ